MVEQEQQRLEGDDDIGKYPLSPLPLLPTLTRDAFMFSITDHTVFF
jgi:hypothetical protein